MITIGILYSLDPRMCFPRASDPQILFFEYPATISQIMSLSVPTAASKCGRHFGFKITAILDYMMSPHMQNRSKIFFYSRKKRTTMVEDVLKVISVLYFTVYTMLVIRL